jgi:heat-inducible transcriptional repressor
MEIECQILIKWLQMIDKKEFLLQSIIRAYIDNLEPIGSSQLKSMYDISYSPATIRGYFKKLGDEGYLAQEHISSGRTPTIEALKEYWENRLNFRLPSVKYSKINQLASQMGLTVFIKQQTNDSLQRILNIENIYMILEFSNFQKSQGFAVTIKYSDALYRFLNDMIGVEIDDIIDISKQVGATSLYEELSKYVQTNIFEIINTKKFLHLVVEYDLDEKSINSFLQGDVMMKLKEGVYYDDLLPHGQIGICHDTKIANEDVKMLVVGDLSKDFEYFYKGIAA